MNISYPRKIFIVNFKNYIMFFVDKPCLLIRKKNFNGGVLKSYGLLKLSKIFLSIISNKFVEYSINDC